MSYRVKDYMSRDIVKLGVEASVLEASKIMLEQSIGYVIIMEKSQPIGIVTERDLVMKVMAEEKDPSKIRVSEIMSTPLVTVDLNATVEDAVNTMAKHKIRRLPVIKGNTLCGIFTTLDLTKNFSKYEDRVTRNLINVQTIYGTSPELGF